MKAFSCYHMLVVGRFSLHVVIVMHSVDSHLVWNSGIGKP